jgi:anthranilate phosphoribosyltransferase
LAALKGGTAEENARAIRDIFAGAKNAFRDIVLLNAGAALVVADKATNIAEGVTRAAQAIDTGRATASLDQARQAAKIRA